MGFCDRHLNLRLLKKHNNNMVQVVTELLQISNGDQYSRYWTFLAEEESSARSKLSLNTTTVAGCSSAAFCSEVWLKLWLFFELLTCFLLMEMSHSARHSIWWTGDQNCSCYLDLIVKRVALRSLTSYWVLLSGNPVEMLQTSTRMGTFPSIVCSFSFSFLGSWKPVLLTSNKLWNRNQCKMLL